MLARPEVQAVGYVERVTEAERRVWERGHVPMRSGSTPGARPADRRPVHYVVAAVSARTSIAPGTDLGADPVRVGAMRRAAATGEAAFTPPVPLFGQDAEGRQQLVAFQPVRTGAPGTRYVSASLTFDRIAASLKAALPPGTAVRIDDDGAELVAIGSLGDGARTRTLRLGERDLRVRTSVSYSGGTAWDEAVLVFGLLLAGAIAAHARHARQRERRISAEVDQRLAERKAVEEDLSRERGFSSTLLSALPDGFIASDNRGLIVVNDAMCRLTGFSRKELLGRLFPHGFWPEDSVAEVQRLRDRVAERGAAQMELQLRTKDDRRVPVLVSASRVDGRNGPVEICVIRDHREQADAARRLSESESQLRALANAAADMVVRLSTAERIEWVSPSSEQVLGFAPEELVGRRFAELFEGEGAGKLGAEPGLHRVRRKDGEIIWTETAVTPTVDETGMVTGMRSSIRDVTDRERARTETERVHTRYRTLAGELPDTMVFMADRDRRFVLAEGGGLRATAWKPSDIEGRTIDEVLGAQRSHFLPYWDAALEGRAGDIAHTSDEGRRYLSRFVPLLAPDGTPDGALAVVTDVTQLRELQARDAGVTTT